MTRQAEPPTIDAVLERAAGLGRQFVAGLGERPVGPPIAVETLRQALGGPLPDAGEDPCAVVETLARSADPGLVASAGPRYFGFVTGGALPAALGADWLTSAWDQNAWTYVASPAAAVVEEIAGGWLVDLLGLPPSTSVGFTTGATMASFSALAAARSAVLARCGCDVEEHGLGNAPEIALFAGEAVHATILAAVQMLGLGRSRVRRVPADEAGLGWPGAWRIPCAPRRGSRSSTTSC
jgi:glutamate/tyrosine decarboxylase-like PLP-dependent enzyme